ncbi:sensor domain-containing protein [Domibacillus robiginosus]|uniref:sensor domain-containing protein n=1 Tax=Domibacillus robiginosus TaxID=1071054 RepID=UPI001FE0FD31|nr:EAL domain-containing protein [Domibacillus robiginosus]
MLNHLHDVSSIVHALDECFSLSITSKDGVILYVNDRFCELSKYDLEEIIGQKHSLFDSGLYPTDHFNSMWHLLKQGQVWQSELHNRAKDGTIYSINATVVPILDQNGCLVNFLSIDIDITDKHQTEKALKQAQKNEFQTTVKHLQNAVFKYRKNEAGHIILTMLEGKLAQKMGLSSNWPRESRLEDLVSKRTFSYAAGYLERGFAGEQVNFELTLLEFVLLVHLSPLFENGKVTEVIGTAIDITERKETERQVKKMAHYDDLTGLANRRQFQKKLTETLHHSAQSQESFAVMFLDLDRFKNINDTLGHNTGDLLLAKVALRLQKCIRRADIAARLGGDEYAILLPSITHEQAQLIAERIQKEISHFFLIENLDIFISTSIGISMYPQDGLEAETLIRNADAAMYFAKESGKNNYQFFTSDLHRDMSNKMMLEREMHRALEQGHFHLDYQPQIDIKTGQTIGVEALIRWNHPKIGPVSPADFIPLAEETGLIIPIGTWVLETACAQNKAWQESGLPPVCMSVNVSLRQFMQKHFAEQIEQILQRTGLSPKWLDVEITESMTADVAHAEQVLNRLRDIGVHVSIDDFGTGYSSLSYLSRFPITKLKIDQSFVQDLTEHHQAIVKTIIDLAQNLNLKVIAEGVETEEQARLLRALNCTEAQGYLYAEPLSSENIKKRLSGL